jgi:hypothetical protein
VEFHHQISKSNSSYSFQVVAGGPDAHDFIIQRGSHRHEQKKCCGRLCSLLLAIANERSALLVNDGATAAPELAGGAKEGLEDPEEGEDGKREGGPVDKLARGLVGKDGPEGPGNGDGGWEVALGAREGVGGSGSLEEEAVREKVSILSVKIKGGGGGIYLQGEEDKDLGPNTGVVDGAVDTKGLETGEDNKDGGPAWWEDDSVGEE